ncbi:adenosine-deaminase (editase) domain protein [Metarhizium robertsii]|uniref:tRNA-specific adenosine deaminase n=2 Tax=Metarhizium robertsii TaxID=568076 RepID=E9F519_METRA|nr:tRNA-specific adenosine deaminase [Metarhizium robertsii ARSEF 23]EFY97072.1 tRNA-specific adenosine deaminase [Metarhizium robertsii ARSEF 23]EXV00637.1 adenosine-deaminase (editase) domain protein [Metarhizium robertsii]
MTTTSRANVIARTVISQFQKLPAKRKPTVRNNGLHEWVPLSGIVAEQDGKWACLALATGMKCLPASKLHEADGNAIHDWHAEVLAIRAFNRFLIDECNTLQQGKSASILQACGSHEPKPFRIRDGLKLHMYCSEAPCGDASMELIMAAQDDASPWDIPPSPVTTESDAIATSLPGRAYFSQLGVVRRKPARGDAPPTLSKSCSDKITLKQCTSLLSSLTSLFIDTSSAYIDTLVLPGSQYSATGCQRAFSERMNNLMNASWPGGYQFRPFTVETTDEEFELSRKTIRERSESIAPSNIAAAWSATGVEETILGGVIQGRKPFDVKGASKMSRRQLWLAAREVSNSLNGYGGIKQLLSSKTYQDVKNGELLADRRHVKQHVRTTALAGWIPNLGDSNFSICTGA